MRDVRIVDGEVRTAAVRDALHCAVGDRCSCAAWRDNIEKVNAAFIVAVARNPRASSGYQGEPFGYCPWCGSGLAPARPVSLAAVREAETECHAEGDDGR